MTKSDELSSSRLKKLLAGFLADEGLGLGRTNFGDVAMPASDLARSRKLLRNEVGVFTVVDGES